MIDEGAPEEQPLLDRVAELRRVVAADGAVPSPAPDPWHAAVDTPSALLLADARSTDPGRRAVAARAAGPLLAALADDLATTAARPLPQQTEVQVGRHAIRFRSMGVDAATVAAAQAATLPPPPSGNRTAQLEWALLAAAGVLAVICVAAGVATFGVTLGATVGATGAWLLFEARRRRSAAHEEERGRRNDWIRLEQQITKVEAAVAELRALAKRTAEEAPTTRARLHEQLTAGGSAALR